MKGIGSDVGSERNDGTGEMNTEKGDSLEAAGNCNQHRCYRSLLQTETTQTRWSSTCDRL